MKALPPPKRSLVLRLAPSAITSTILKPVLPFASVSGVAKASPSHLTELAFLEAAENMLRSIDHFSSTVASVRGELTGIVHLGTVDAMHTNTAAPLDKAIARFSALAPKVTLACGNRFAARSPAATSRRALFPHPHANRGIPPVRRRDTALYGRAKTLLRLKPRAVQKGKKPDSG